MNKKSWVAVLGGLALCVGALFVPWSDGIRWLMQSVGIAIIVSPFWLPWAWRMLKSQIWWLSAVISGIAMVAMFATGHLWAFAALFALEVVTLVALVSWLLHGKAEFRREMEEEKPDD